MYINIYIYVYKYLYLYTFILFIFTITPHKKYCSMVLYIMACGGMLSCWSNVQFDFHQPILDDDVLQTTYPFPSLKKELEYGHTSYKDYQDE